MSAAAGLLLGQAAGKTPGNAKAGEKLSSWGFVQTQRAKASEVEVSPCLDEGAPTYWNNRRRASRCHLALHKPPPYQKVNGHQAWKPAAAMRSHCIRLKAEPSSTGAQGCSQSTALTLDSTLPHCLLPLAGFHNACCATDPQPLS